MPEYGQPEDDDDDRVEVTLTEADDPRLAGWVQTNGFFVQPEKSVTIESIEAMETGDLFDRSERLVVTVATQRPGEEPSVFPFPLFFRKADDKSLDSLETFRAALRRTLKTDDFSAYWSERKSEDDPFPTGLIEPAEIDTAFLLTMMVEGFVQELEATNPELAKKAAVHLGQAYHIGRSVAVWELKQQFEDAAKAGLDIPRQKRAGGQARAEQIKAAADSWHQPTIAWLQGLIDAQPLAVRPLSYSKLASMILNQWEDRGFSEGSVNPPDILYLAKTLLPRWVKDGLIDRPTAAQQVT